MTREEVFEAWAPAGALWSQWAKPVLFAQIGMQFGAAVPRRYWRAEDVSRVPEPGDAAIVVDLPAIVSLSLGMALGQRGYRPVPLYNACMGANAACDLGPVLAALQAWAPEIARMSIDPGAPPAFLLDAERLTPQRPVGPGVFDNRWVVFPQDFPSGNFLLSRGIRRVVLVQDRDAPMNDLAHVLLRWQEAGIAIEDRIGERISVKKPSHFRALWERVLVATGLSRSAAGGFGAPVPLPPPSGGGYSGIG